MPQRRYDRRSGGAGTRSGSAGRAARAEMAGHRGRRLGEDLRGSAGTSPGWGSRAGRPRAGRRSHRRSHAPRATAHPQPKPRCCAAARRRSPHWRGGGGEGGRRWGWEGGEGRRPGERSSEGETGRGARREQWGEDKVRRGRRKKNLRTGEREGVGRMKNKVENTSPPVRNTTQW